LRHARGLGVGGYAQLIRDQELWSSVGYCILVAGLVGDIVVLVIPEKRKWLEKSLAAFFTLMIIAGVAIEHRADAKISVLISQEEEAASREIKTANDQLLLQGPREKLLVGEARQKLVGALKPFARQRVDVRRSTLIGAINGVPTGVSAIIKESSGLAESLIGVLKEAKWQSPENPLAFGFPQGEGIRIQVLRNASARTHNASNALVKALRDVPLTVNGPESITEEPPKRPTGMVVSPPLTADTIILVVDPK
jgi:hypothetical protein